MDSVWKVDAPEPDKLRADVKKYCRRFLIDLIQQIQARLPSELRRLELMSHLTPSVAVQHDRPDILPLVDLIHCGDELTKAEIMDQWQRLPSVASELSEALKNCKNLDKEPEKFWFAVLKLGRIHDDEKRTDWSPFAKLATFALEILTLPHSNATVERLFSIMNIVKSKLTNRLSTAMMNAILVIRFAVKV
jgi:hypothetical protein